MSRPALSSGCCTRGRQELCSLLWASGAVLKQAPSAADTAAAAAAHAGCRRVEPRRPPLGMIQQWVDCGKYAKATTLLVASNRRCQQPSAEVGGNHGEAIPRLATLFFAFRAHARLPAHHLDQLPDLRQAGARQTLLAVDNPADGRTASTSTLHPSAAPAGSRRCGSRHGGGWWARRQPARRVQTPRGRRLVGCKNCAPLPAPQVATPHIRGTVQSRSQPPAELARWCLRAPAAASPPTPPATMHVLHPGRLAAAPTPIRLGK